MFFSNWVGDSILDEARPHNPIKPLFRYEGRRPGLVFNFPIQDDPGAATSNQTEGTAFTETVLTTSSQTATALLNGQVATVTASLAGFYNGMADLEAADATGSFVAVLLPAMLATVRTDIEGATGTVWAGPAFNTGAAGVASAQPECTVGAIGGVPICPTSAAGTNCMFVRGVSHGVYEVWDIRTETHRDTFQPGTQIAATTLYGVATIRAAWSTDVA